MAHSPVAAPAVPGSYAEGEPPEAGADGMAKVYEGGTEPGVGPATGGGVGAPGIGQKWILDAHIEKPVMPYPGRVFHF